MLVLSRRVGESVMIGHDVVVTVLEVRGDMVRVGIKAPRDVDVHREEVYAELQLANRSAASPTPGVVDSLAAVVRSGHTDEPEKAQEPERGEGVSPKD